MENCCTFLVRDNPSIQLVSNQEFPYAYINDLNGNVLDYNDGLYAK